MDTVRAELLDRARAAYADRRWADALAMLQRTDEVSPLDVADLDRMAWSAGMLDRDGDVLGCLERLYSAYSEADNPEQTARAAFFIGFRLLGLGEVGRASAWMQRAPIWRAIR